MGQLDHGRHSGKANQAYTVLEIIWISSVLEETMKLEKIIQIILIFRVQAKNKEPMRNKIRYSIMLSKQLRKDSL